MTNSTKSLLFLTFLLVVFLMAACSNTPQSAQKKIDKIAQEMETRLPQMLDEDTKLVNVYTRKLELVSEYELVNYKASEGENNIKTKIELYLQKEVCPGIKKKLLNSGVSSRYIYKDNDGRTVGDWLIAPGDC